MLMKIYTKTGDKGTTSLIGGTRVPKNNIRLEAYGSVDELNSYLGLVRAFDIDAALKEELVAIQQVLFMVGGNLATDRTVNDIRPVLLLEDADIERMEKAIDRMDAELPPLTSFILPGGDQAAACCHIARTVCRRVERRILDMGAEYEVEEIVLRYINRLSDYLFMLARKLAFDAGVEEIDWNPSKRNGK